LNWNHVKMICPWLEIILNTKCAYLCHNVGTRENLFTFFKNNSLFFFTSRKIFTFLDPIFTGNPACTVMIFYRYTLSYILRSTDKSYEDFCIQFYTKSLKYHSTCTNGCIKIPCCFWVKGVISGAVFRATWYFTLLGWCIERKFVESKFLGQDLVLEEVYTLYSTELTEIPSGGRKHPPSIGAPFKKVKIYVVATPSWCSPNARPARADRPNVFFMFVKLQWGQCKLRTSLENVALTTFFRF
jgi:hypothetical protein